MDAYIEQSGHGRDEWRRTKAEERPNLRGSAHYVDTPRHANYVDAAVYRRILSELRERFGWPDPDEAFYQPMRTPLVSTGAAANVARSPETVNAA